MRVFYSWQSDLPNRTNRGLIEEALRKALAQVQRQGEVEVVPVLDRDTQGTSGAPDIARTIFDKIDQAEVFVADTTLINRKAIDEYGVRPTPNPNVLVELGYAAHSLGWERIIVVVNSAHGSIEELPFDFRARRVVTYKLTEDDKPAAARQELVGKLVGALGPILGQGLMRRVSGPDVKLQWRETRPVSRDPYDLHESSEPPFAPLDAERLVLPAPLFADTEAFWAYFDDEERAAKRDREKDPIARRGRQSPEAFRKTLADPANFIDWYVYAHWTHGVVQVYLDLTNTGTVPAHDIDVQINLPLWLHHTHAGSRHRNLHGAEWPFWRYMHDRYSYKHCNHAAPQFGGLPSSQPFIRVEGERSVDQRHDRVLRVRHAQLMHTYQVSSRTPICLVALPGAPIGACELEYEVFCREMPERQRRKLRLVVESKNA